MKRVIFSLLVVFMLVMTALLAANLPPAVVAQSSIVLECHQLTPSPIKVGDVIDFIGTISEGDEPYYWDWAVNGTPEASFYTTLTYTFFSFSRNEPGLYEVCVNVTDYSGNKSNTCCKLVTVIGPSLTIDKTDVPDPVDPGGTLKYTITVTNNGSDIATGVIVVDTYDATVLTITDYGGGTPSPPNIITWSGGSLAAGGSLSYNITATVSPTAPGGYIIDNDADVTCTEGASDSTSIETTVAGLPLILECYHDKASIDACDGNVITFTSTVSQGVSPYYWDWRVDGELKESFSTTLTFSQFYFSSNETGLHEVCVNVTDGLGKQAGPCCKYVTVNPALRLDLSPAEYTNLVNTYHSITATVSQCGIPMSDVGLTWGISGVGNFSGTPGGITNIAGEADALITSSQPGTTTVTCAVTSNTSVSDFAIKYWMTAVTPPRGGGGGGCPPIKYLTVDWDGHNTTERLRANDELEVDLLGPNPDGSHSLLLEQGTQAPNVDGEVYYLITIRELELGDIPPLPENTIAVLAFNIIPTGSVFNKDIFLTLGFNQLPENALEETLTLAYYDGVSGVWVPLESTLSEQDGVLTISAPLRHFTVFAVLAEVTTPSPPPPAHFVHSGLNIVTNVETGIFVTKTGESVTITANVLNDGGQGGTDTVELKLDGETVDTAIVTLGAGQSQQVSFTASGLDYGQHEVEVDGLSDEFTTSQTVTWWLIIVIIVAIGLIIWGVVWWRRRRRKAHQAAQKDKTETPEPEA